MGYQDCNTEREAIMQQQTFAEVPFEQYRKPTPRERFLDEMNRVVPWADFVSAIEPVCPEAEGPGYSLLTTEVSPTSTIFWRRILPNPLFSSDLPGGSN